MPTQTKPDLHVRWMIRRDLEQVAEIEAVSYADACTESDLAAMVSERNTIGMVAVDRKHDRLIRGYMIYTLEKGRLVIRRLAVALHLRRQGVGRSMTDKLKVKLGGMGQRRTRLRIDVDDTELGAHLFLRSQGFNAVAVDHRAGSYAFVYTHREG